MSAGNEFGRFYGFLNDLTKGEFTNYWFDLPQTRADMSLERLDWFLDNRLLRFLADDARV